MHNGSWAWVGFMSRVASDMSIDPYFGEDDMVAAVDYATILV